MIYLQDPDVTLYHGDVLETLRELPAESVDCVVTSPPYWGLRDYGTPGQLGLEPTPEQYVERMVEVFREVRRVLATHGTVWLNLGDSYAGAPVGSFNGGGFKDKSAETGGRDLSGVATSGTLNKLEGSGLKQKDLCGIPWRVAFALQADGWYLRSDIIWAKPNPMPESVTDRPTKAHEYVFLLSKQPRYFFDAEAVREPYAPPGPTNPRARYGGIMPSEKRGKESGQPKATGDGTYTLGNRRELWDARPQTETLDGSEGEAPRGPDGRRNTHVEAANGSIQHRDGERWPNGGRNIRSVWEIATQPYPEAHFATFPEELARRAIAAGCPEQVCRACGKARERVVEKEDKGFADRTFRSPHRTDTPGMTNGQGATTLAKIVERETLGFTDCGHTDYRPGITLDPFIGSGTVAHVARKLGRHAVGIDLSAEYLALAAKRLQQQSLFALSE